MLHAGDKRLMYEPSIRVPMLLRWPAKVAGGRIDDEHMVLNVDVAATLLDVGGADAPRTLHRRSWRPLLDEERTPWREAFLYEFYEYPAVHCVRKHRGVRRREYARQRERLRTLLQQLRRQTGDIEPPGQVAPALQPCK